MKLRTALLATGLLVLAGCKLELPASGNESVSMGSLSAEMVEFQRQDGPQCPGSPNATPENIPCASVKISYPKVLGDSLNPQAVDAINQFIQAQLLEFSDEAGKQPGTLDELATLFIADYKKDPSPIGNWELERHVGLIFGKGPLVTLSLTETGYTGGAHPFSGQRYFVLSADTGQQLTLADLLTPGYESGLDTAGESAFRQVRNLAPTANLEAEGYLFENNAFHINTNFGVMADGLAFTFNPYEVAAYALGPTEFTVPYRDIRNLIAADSPLNAVLQ